MSSNLDPYNFIVQKNDKLINIQTKKINMLIGIAVLILICVLCVYSYKFYVTEINIYPYNYNTQHGDYDLNYLIEQDYISSLSASDLTKYLSLTNPNKLIAIKQSLITSITS